MKLLLTSYFGQLRENLSYVELGKSEGAFSVLVGRYNDLLYRHAFRMLGEADDAEDAVQTAWIKAYRSLSRCRDRDRAGSR